MNKSLFRYIFFALFTGMVIITGCSEQETRVIIFHTNDTHSQIENYPALAWLVDQEREVNEHVLIVSAGDIFSGNPMVDYYEPRGYPKIDFMNRVGYNLHTIGNHEFDYGLDVLADRMEQANFPFILANLNTENSVMDQPAPYHVIRAGRRKIAFLGLVQLNNMGIPSAHPDNMTGIEFYQPIEKAGEFEFLTGNADAVIALTHHGFRSDTIMATRYPWFDVIIGGHSHTLVRDPRKHNGVIVTQAGSNMEYAGKVTLVFSGSMLVEKKAEMIELGSIDGRDEELAVLVNDYNNNPSLNRVIGNLVNPIEGKNDLGGFITDTYREYGNFDFAFQNFGGIRINSMEGDIRISDIFRMDPFGNELVSMNLTYSELKELIGNSLSSRNNTSVQISGGTIEVHLGDDDRLTDVKIFDGAGGELDPGKKYLVGMPSYMASAFDFEREDPGTGMGIITAQVLIDSIIKLKSIDYKGSSRSRVVRN